MARRRKTKSKRRSKQGVSLLGIAETYMLLNVATQTLFNNDPINFIVGKDSGGPNSAVLNVKEMFGYGTHGGPGIYGPTADKLGIAQTFGAMTMHNLSKNWTTGLAGMILIPIGFRLTKAVARPAISRTNRLLNKAGVGKTVKV